MGSLHHAAPTALAAILISLSAGVLAQGRLPSQEALGRIQPGVTTSAQVQELLGAPARTLRFPARGIEALEYDSRDFGRGVVVSIAVGSDGKVRDIQRIMISIP